MVKIAQSWSKSLKDGHIRANTVKIMQRLSNHAEMDKI